MIIGVYTSKKLTSKYVFTNNLLIIKYKMHIYIGETYQIPFYKVSKVNMIYNGITKIMCLLIWFTEDTSLLQYS